MTQSDDPASLSYDRVPYPNISHSFTHPDDLATIATLLGSNPPSVESCRVLELGCAGGGNLIPMAGGIPQGEFIGLDTSSVQIAQGKAAITSIGLKNITLKHMSILDVNEDLGEFDYIITHGVFSWVPEIVQDKILSICKQHLAPNGVAYVSYNTYPGWRMLSSVRDMLLFHTRDVIEPPMRIARARNMLDFLADTTAAASEISNNSLARAYGILLESERVRLSSLSDSYVLHEELEEINNPIYFHQFAEWAARHDLQYLSEANLSDVFLNDMPSQTRDTLLKMSRDLIELEQYIDFLRCRTFRKTLLVHQEMPVSRKLHTERVSTMYIASNARPASSEPDIHSKSVEEFCSPTGVKLAIDHPVTKAAMMYLASIWPKAVAFDALLESAYLFLHSGEAHSSKPAAPTPAQRTQDANVLRANLLRGFAYSNRLIELHVYAPHFVTEISTRPVAGSWSRFQAQFHRDHKEASGDEQHEPFTVTNLRHERIELDAIDCYVLGLLDGKSDRDALLNSLDKLFEGGEIVLHHSSENGQFKDKPQESTLITDSKQAREILLDETLHRLAHVAMLVA